MINWAALALMVMLAGSIWQTHKRDQRIEELTQENEELKSAYEFVSKITKK